MTTGQPSEQDETYPQVLSLVYEPADNGDRPITRRLPALYFGGSLAFSDRSIANVEECLISAIKRIDTARHQPTFHLQACRYQDRYGIYGADFNVRSRFRRALIRQGLEISRDPFVNQARDGELWSDDLKHFKPRFAILSTDEQGSPTQAGLLFYFTSRRLGLIPADEFKHLSEKLQTVVPLGGQSAAEIASQLENDF